MNIRQFIPTAPTTIQSALSAFVATLTLIMPIMLTVIGAIGVHSNSELQTDTKVTVSQGMPVNVGANGTCTIGYVDAVTHTAYTAAHCFTRTDSTTAYIRNNFSRILIGEAHLSTNGVDIAMIELSDNVTVGENSYSGNTTLSKADVHADDKVCSYGAKSNHTDCLDVLGLANAELLAAGQARIPGDSGGPVWLTDAAGNNKGLIGIHSGYVNSSIFTTPTDVAMLISSATWDTTVHAAMVPTQPAPMNDNPPITIAMTFKQ